jgi:tetratricopeptide (TPR) repeat protein
MLAASALSWSVLRALKHRIRGLLASIVFIGLPAKLLMPGLSVPVLIVVTGVVAFLWSMSRRVSARIATQSLSRGDSGRAQRLYWMLWATSLDDIQRSACRLSLAACAASRGDYDLALRRVSIVSKNVEGALLAVSLNLQAYCMGREGRNLEEALEMAQRAIELRPHVAGFRHTRGMLLLDLGRLDESGRDLEATWRESDGNELLEAERCFDLGRLWSARGHKEYALDYFERAWRASPESRWADASRPHLVGSASQQSLEAQL